MRKTIYSKEHKFMVQQLKRARKKAGLHQKKVAKLLGRTQSYVSKIESGQRRIDFLQLKEHAVIYKKSINYFIQDDLNFRKRHRKDRKVVSPH